MPSAVFYANLLMARWAHKEMFGMDIQLQACLSKFFFLFFITAQLFKLQDWKFGEIW